MKTMKATEQITTRLVMGCVLTLGMSSIAQAQLQFTGILATEESAIKLNWRSESNSIYRVEYLPELLNSNVWNILYDDYPSHGSNTFWLDTGDYSRTPEILHPKSTTNRFYRMVKIATNSLPVPVVSVVAPASSSILSNEVTISVSVTSTNSLYSLRLFVDGQDLGPSEDDGTNWVINTTEWSNGQHVIFAAAKVADRYPTTRHDNSPKYAWGVSSYVPVAFNNFISRISFSEPFFEPDLGQTQRVSAVFGSYANWTLQVVDEFDNAVRTVTGSGTSLAFVWDGSGDGGAALPNGVYYYIISAEEASQPLAMSSSEDTSAKSLSVNKVDAGDGYEWIEIPLPPLPYPLKTPDSMKSVWIKRPKVEVKVASSEAGYLNGYQPMESSTFGNGPAAATTAPRTPKRPPTEPVKGQVGTFGVVAFDYPISITSQNPTDPFGQVELEGIIGNWGTAPIPDAGQLAGSFGKVIKKAAYKQLFNKSGKDVTTMELRRNDLGIGGSNLFHQVNLGLFLAHGNYGTSLDFSASTGGGSLQTYFTVDGTNNAADSWIRLSDFGFGGNLRWMGLMACNGLRDENYNSMLNRFALPIGDTFHLLCGSTRVMGFNEYLGESWAKGLKAKQPVGAAWFAAGTATYKRAKAGSITNTYIYRVSGWTSCFVDRINSWNDPDTTTDTLDEQTQQVYP